MTVGDDSQGRYPPPYEVTTYLQTFLSYFDAFRFSMLPRTGSPFSVLPGSELQDKVAGTRRKNWEHRRGRGAVKLKTACRKMDYPYVRCWKRNDYQQRLAALLAGVHPYPTVPTAVITDLLCLPADLKHFYFVGICAYWLQEFYFEARSRSRRSAFSGW